MITLPAILDLTEAAALKSGILAALPLGGGLEVDASQVQRVTSPCLQILASAARDFARAGGPPLRLINMSPAFSGAVIALALSPVFHETGAIHV